LRLFLAQLSSLLILAVVYLESTGHRTADS